MMSYEQKAKDTINAFMPDRIIITRQPIHVILGNAANAVGLTVSELRAHCKEPEITARRWCVWAILSHHGLGPSRIGRACNRDHSTISHGVSRHSKLCKPISIENIDDEYLSKKNSPPRFNWAG